MENISKIILSPPVGSRLFVKNVSSVLGSYTLHKRKGLFLQIVKTIRLTKKGWVNKIGLRNKGVENIKVRRNIDIISISSLQENDFENILEILLKHKANKTIKTNTIEINISCPNENVFNIKEDVLQKYLQNFQIIVKTSPCIKENTYAKLIKLGVKNFHISNTLPSERGGLSGKILKPMNIETIKTLRRKYKESIYIIAGGGIYSYKDLLDYKNAGADSFSLSTLFFNPFKTLFFLISCYKNGV